MLADGKVDFMRSAILPEIAEASLQSALAVGLAATLRTGAAFEIAAASADAGFGKVFDTLDSLGDVGDIGSRSGHDLLLRQKVASGDVSSTSTGYL